MAPAPEATDLAALGADIDWPDAEASAVARSAEHGAIGRLTDLVEWLAGVQGTFPPSVPTRPRCLVVGPVSDAVAGLAASLQVGVRSIEVDAGSDVAAALAAGAAVADDEAEAGADLLIVGDPDAGPLAAVVVSLLSGAEPVALLPRGAAAVDTAEWVALAADVRDTRRRVAALRNDADALLIALDHPRFALTAGLLLRAAARRTPVVLDGAAALAAAVLGYDLQSRAARWWRIADTSADPVHTRAAAELGQTPLLDLGTSSGDGLAGLLTVPLLRAAAELGNTRD